MAQDDHTRTLATPTKPAGAADGAPHDVLSARQVADFCGGPTESDLRHIRARRASSNTMTRGSDDQRDGSGRGTATSRTHVACATVSSLMADWTEETLKVVV